MKRQGLWESFFLGGFECATGYNVHRQPIDQIAATQHERYADEDYRRLRSLGISAVRDGIRWNLVDRGGKYDFSSVAPLVRAADRNQIEVIWDLFHYGYPEDVDLFCPTFPERFADYCLAVAKWLRPRTEGTLWITPVNEPSYFSWAAGHASVFAPHATDRGSELKYQLCKAAIMGINAIRSVDPRARMVNADPACHVVAPEDRPDLQEEADRFNRIYSRESFDMLCGKMHPELGGSRAHLDVVGVNYYWTNQWELTKVGIPLEEEDPRKLSLSQLVMSLWEQYGGDIMITETAHVNENRPGWVREVARECEILFEAGIPLRGVCLYPILGMPEWHAPQTWTRMGLWDLEPDASGRLRRLPHLDTIQALREAQCLERWPHHREPVPQLEAVA